MSTRVVVMVARKDAVEPARGCRCHLASWRSVTDIAAQADVGFWGLCGMATKSEV